MRGPGRAAAVAVLASVLSPLTVLAQSPTPSSSPDPTRTFALTARGEAADGRFRLTIETDATQVTPQDAVEIRTTWVPLGTEPVRICTGGGGPVVFVVEQLDGPFDPGGEADAGAQMMTIEPGTVQTVPFQKSGGYDLSDPMAPQYAAWFDDPELHLPPGVFRITAHAGYAVGDCAPGTTLDASVVIAVSVAPPASPTPSPSSPTAFPWPTVPPSSGVPVPRAPGPVGRPDATGTRDGIRVELWLSSPEVAPGDWVVAVVRTTNLGRDAAWSAPGSCDASGTHIQADIRDAIPPGAVQTGNAARFKVRAIRDSGIRIHDFQRWSEVARKGTGIRGAAWAECTGSWVAHRLRPGQATLERFAWYPSSSFDDDDLPLQPLPPGRATITASWPFVTRGARPVPRAGIEPRTDPIRLSVPLRITGEGPGTPSIPELIDRALADPEWAAWVDRDPDRSDWTHVWATAWPGPDYPDHPLWAGLIDPNPWGILTLELIQGRLGSPGSRGVVHLDPWTGDVLDVAFQ